MLNCFEDINVIMEEYDVKFYEYYEDVRGNFIKILNEIVDSYVYKKPGLMEEGELHDKLKNAETQNLSLKQHFQALEAKNEELMNEKKEKDVAWRQQELRIKELEELVGRKEAEAEELENHVGYLESQLTQLESQKTDNGRVNKVEVERPVEREPVEVRNVQMPIEEIPTQNQNSYAEIMKKERQLDKYAEENERVETPPVEEGNSEPNVYPPMNVNNFIAQNLTQKPPGKNEYNFDTIQNKAISNDRLLQWNNTKELNQPINKVNFKEYSLKTLKELIVEVYEAKATFDDHCVKEGKPKDTLEQFLFRHFKNKYGLNNLVIGWTYSTLNAIRKYSLKDNDVTVFGLVG